MDPNYYQNSPDFMGGTVADSFKWPWSLLGNQCSGDAFMVRFADDSVFCFQYEHGAKAFY
ncbi:hypothetical protein [Acetobacterium sp.]|uniref:hypothetical protein n=1 Tax=Acetobacterium sp. TaxID=1872094 RepID=UPI000CA74A90|nr:hypothetical protein [Acetobacterium sp.]MDO9492914.1 hypothetical protein [Acetobacterium sp.]PKM75528.1 MAG: hypothetical protein CVU92_00870 [Firmicutes bacterium HGW-Firmicutes-17]